MPPREPRITHIKDLRGVAIDAISEGQYMVWNNTTKKFGPKTLAVGDISGVSASVADVNRMCDPALAASDGLGLALRVAKATFDCGVPANLPVGPHSLGVTLPIKALVLGGFYQVLTGFDSAAHTSTVALSLEGANDLLSAIIVSNAALVSAGRKAITPKFNTPESSSILCTAARDITATVAVQDLTVGKLQVTLFYVMTP